MRKRGRSRAVSRKSGKIKGDVSGLGPLLFIGIPGASGTSSEREGVFVLGGALGPGMMTHTGMLLPLSQCRHEGIRKVLLSIHELRDRESYCDFVNEAEVRLSDVREYDIHALGEDRSAGALALEATAGCLKMLCDHFSYVDLILDDPGGDAVPESYSRFRWTTYGNLMEWFHSGLEKGFGAWSRIRIHLMFDGLEGVAALDMFREGGAITHPELDLPRHFRAHPEVGAAQMLFQSEPHSFGYGEFTLRIGDQERTLFLSDAYPPYENLVRWLREIECSNLPIGIEMEEEGPTTYLEAHSVGDGQRILLVHGENNAKVVFIQGIVDRRLFVNGFREELARFVMEAFDEKRWDVLPRDKDKNLAATLLNDFWLHGSKKKMPQ